MNVPVAVDKLQKDVRRKYSKYRITTKKISYSQFCRSGEFELQPSQRFMEEWLGPKTNNRGVLVMHKPGAGKTCTAGRVCEAWKHTRRVIFVGPASLLTNFRDELRSPCCGYLTPAERRRIALLSPFDPEYIEIIRESDRRIDEVYEIYSYNKFVELILSRKFNLDRAVLVIDEVQNIVSATGSMYSIIRDAIYAAPAGLRVMLMSATPMFDQPVELALTLNLLRPARLLPTGTEFNETFIAVDTSGQLHLKSADLLMNYARGLVSYYAGAPSYVYPEVRVRYVRANMSKFQRGQYDKVNAGRQNAAETSIFHLPKDFMLGPRMISNVAFPNGKINDAGAKSFEGAALGSKLHKFSTKLAACLDKIEKARGTVFVYSNFKEWGGLRALMKCLEFNGYTNLAQTQKPGRRQFVVFSSDTTAEFKDRAKAMFNHPDNVDGRMLKIVLGSPSTKEGISFRNCRNIIILEPYWNMSRIIQIIARASRHCSHRDLPPDQRWVKVFILIATSPGIKTVDEIILDLMEVKHALISQFEQAIIAGAVDRLVLGGYGGNRSLCEAK